MSNPKSGNPYVDAKLVVLANTTPTDVVKLQLESDVITAELAAAPSRPDAAAQNARKTAIAVGTAAHHNNFNVFDK